MRPLDAVNRHESTINNDSSIVNQPSSSRLPPALAVILSDEFLKPLARQRRIGVVWQG
jgi:hypothetical protein